LRLAKQALVLDPSDPAYALEVHRVRFEDGAMHIKAGYKLRAVGQFAQALAEFLKANDTDPASDLAEQDIRITREMIGGKSSAEPCAMQTRDDAARDVSDKRTDRLSPVPELRPLNGELLDLRMMNKPRILFETVCKIAGVNIIFDPDYNTQQTIASQQFDSTRTTLEQALDQLALATRSFWKPLSENTIFVTVDNPIKRREYAEQVVRVLPV
jgi:general secretion pathway protein D